MKEGIVLWIINISAGNMSAIFIFAGSKYVLNGKISKPEICLGLSQLCYKKITLYVT